MQKCYQKKRLLKKVLSIILCIAMFVGVIGIPAEGVQAKEYQSGNWSYVLEEDGSGICVTSYRNSTIDNESTLTVPESIDGYSVLGISSYDNYFFSYDSIITEIILPDTLTYIGEDAFDEEVNLKKVQIPNSVVSIGSRAFYKCKSLEEVVFSDNMDSIGDYAFYGCTSLEKIQIPASVKSVGYAAFCDCRSLQEFDVSENNTEYFDKDGVLCTSSGVWDEEDNYLGDYGTKVISYPGGKKGNFHIEENMYLDEFAFVNALSLESFTIDENNIDYSVVDGVLYSGDKKQLQVFPCAKTGKFNIPEGTEGIQTNAFSNSSLSEIVIPDSVTWLGNYAFYQCNNLTKLLIGKNLPYDELNRCGYLETDKNLSEINVSSENTTMTTVDGVIYNAEITKLLFVPLGYAGRLELPDTVETADRRSLHGYDEGKNIHYYAEKITEIYLGKNYAGFEGEIYGSDGETVVKKMNVCTLGLGITSLSKFEVSEENTSFCAKEGWLYSADGKILIDCPKTLSGEIVIPDGVTAIPQFGDMFYKCLESVTAVTIPASVTEMNMYSSLGRNDLTIYGYEGSVAEACAEYWSCPFVALNQNTDSPSIPPSEEITPPSQVQSPSPLEMEDFDVYLGYANADWTESFFQDSTHSVKITQDDTYSISFTAISDTTDIQVLTLDTKLTTIPADFIIIPKNLTVGNQSYHLESGTAIGDENANYRISIRNPFDGTTDALGANPVPVKAGEVVTVEFSVAGTGKTAPVVTATPDITTSPTTTPAVTAKPKKETKEVSKPDRVKWKSCKGKKWGRIAAKWKKVSGADGYQIQYARKRSFKGKKSETAYGKSTTLWLKSKKTYYVRVRAYKYGNIKYKVYGNWSTVKKVKTKK